MRPSRGMGDIAPSKMPKGRTIQRTDKPQDVEVYKKGGKTDGKWIQGAIKKPGALRKELGVKAGNTIPKSKLAAAAKKPGKLGQRARFAETLSKLRK